jgi:hypothetical protein
MSIILPGNPICWANLVANLDTLCTGAFLALLIKESNLRKVWLSRTYGDKHGLLK